MSNKVMSFFIPNRVAPKVAAQIARVLVGDLQLVLTDYSSEIYLTTAILYNSWCSSESSTIKGLLNTLIELNVSQNAIALAEKISRNKDIFRDPNSGNLSIEMLEVQSMLLHCLSVLAKSIVPFEMTKKLTFSHLETIALSKEEEEYDYLERLEAIRKSNNYFSYENNLGAEIIEVLKKKIALSTKENTSVSLSIKQISIDDHEDNKVKLKLFDTEQVIKAAKKVADGGQESNAVQKRLLIEMSSNDGMRELTQIPNDYMNNLLELYERFPHFSEVIDFISERISLASCGTNGKSLKIAPILLKGPPGTGKTYFSQELARYFKLHFIEKDLSITSEAFVIVGMDSCWKNSKPGVVFESLVNGTTANPLICLNEIDKCQDSIGKNSPLTTLHWLLEPTSSKKFQDEFIPVDIRADHIVWILTANEGFIPDPILSRLEVFNISEPTQEQCKAIAKSVWKSLCEREFPEGHNFPIDLNEDVLNDIASISPRIMRKTLTQAAAIASKDNRSFILLVDCEKALKRYQENKRKLIGF